MLSALMFTIVAAYGFPFDGEKMLSEFPGAKAFARELDDDRAVPTYDGSTL